ncbi:MAG TPA: DUF3866 family protein [Coriobacteriia bacterium]
MRLVWVSIVSVLSEEPGIQRFSLGPEAPESRGAICYPELTGRCAPGEHVLVNTTAVDLGLGTGGWHLVVARAGDGEAFAQPSGGHVMKLRYTPLQRDVLAVEEPASPHHAVMAAAEELGGMPVVCCGLHSQVAPAAAAVKRAVPHARVVYVMTDAASLPLALSDLVRACRRTGLLDAVVSTGQAFGGDLEAVTLHSGMLAARHVAAADVAVVANGPGVTGTGTPFGHGGVAQAQAIDAASVLGGRPVAALRVSFADPRGRHRGVSHHTLGVLGRLTLSRALVAVPSLPAEQSAEVESSLAQAGVWDRHDRADAPGLLPSMPGVDLATMGRTPDRDPAFFAAAAAAGEVAARFLG